MVMGQRVSTAQILGGQPQCIRQQLLSHRNHTLPHRNHTLPREDCVTLIVDKNQKYIFIDSEIELPVDMRGILNAVWQDVFQALHVDRSVVYMGMLYQFTAIPITSAHRVIGGIMFIRHSPCDVINPLKPDEQTRSNRIDRTRFSLDIETERRILSSFLQRPEQKTDATPVCPSILNTE
jgi:hypothetical protein